MVNIINMNTTPYEKTYQKFLDSFIHCLGTDDTLTQVRIAIDAGVSEAYISQVVNGKKEAGFKTQVKIAAACGHEYTDFLTLLDTHPKEKTIISFRSTVEKKHFEVIQTFEDPETALNFNCFLSELEKLDVKSYEEIFGKVRGLVRDIKNKKGVSEKAVSGEAKNHTGS